MKKIKFSSTGFDGLVVYERLPVSDSRGSFQRMYCKNTLAQIGCDKTITQINHSFSKERGVIRGLHYQEPPFSETKIISCLAGAVYDVAVDLRAGSSTFLQYYGIELNADKPMSIVIPEGFAHGFQTLTSDCQLLYLHTADYAPDAERGFNMFDETIGIEWPLKATQISERDKVLPMIIDDFPGVKL